MKKNRFLAFVAIPIALSLGFLCVPGPQDPGEQPGAGYGLESGHISMQEVGRLLERMGREIQENGSIAIGGNTYSFTGFGGMELGINSREGGAGIEISFGSNGRTGTPERGDDYDPYKRTGRYWEATDLADILDQLGQTLSGQGVFALEDHRVAFRGAASIDERLYEGPARGRRQPFEYSAVIVYGEGDVQLPVDEDVAETEASTLTRQLASRETEGAGQDAMAEFFTSFAEALRGGVVRVGEQEFALGEDPVGFHITHVAANDGGYDKIEFGLAYGPVPPMVRPQPGERWGDDVENRPTTELAAMLQQVGAQMLEDGMFELGGITFTMGERASWEIGANQRGFSVEMSYVEPLGN